MLRLLLLIFLLTVAEIHGQGKGLYSMTFSDAWNSLPIYPIGDLAKGKAEENWNAAWAEIFNGGKRK